MPKIIEKTGQGARQELDDALAGEYEIKLLLFGDNKEMDNIFLAAKTRAEISKAREVIWIKDPVLLSGEEETKYRSKKGNIVACMVDIDGQPIKCFEKHTIADPLAIEMAYNEAQQS